MENQNKNPLGPAKATGLPQNTQPKPWPSEDKIILSQALGKICALQRQYGKNLGELETLVEGFAWVLADYSVQDVLRGMGIYLKTNSNIPTPSEILAIIDPPKEPFKPDWEYYKRLESLRKSGGDYALNDDEIAYMQACEAHSQSKLRNAA